MSTSLEQATAALVAYLDAEDHRDLGGVLAHITEDHCGFGTGPDEIIRNLAEVRAILGRQFAEVSDQPSHRAEILHAVEVTPGVCLFMALISYQITINGVVETLRPRFAFVLRRGPEDEKWRLQHLHASFPWREQREGESYPLAQIEERNRALEALVVARTAELNHTLDLLQKLATTDKLTGLSNRAKLDELIAEEHRFLKRHPRASSIAILDLDHFKAINDRHGHLVGDRVLRDVAEIARRSVREIDRVGRWGGEEFLILIPEANTDGARTVAQRIRERMAQHDFGLRRPVTASIGIAEYRAGETTDAWISRADQMLYRAKNGGRDRVICA